MTAADHYQAASNLAAQVDATYAYSPAADPLVLAAAAITHALLAIGAELGIPLASATQAAQTPAAAGAAAGTPEPAAAVTAPPTGQ